MITSMGKVKASTGIRLAPDQIDEIERLAEEARLPKTAVMRQLIDEALRARSGKVSAEPLRPPASADAAQDWHYTEIPIAGIAAAGIGRQPALVDSGETAKVINPLARKAQRGGWWVVRVVGNSMEPQLYDGDLVLVQPQSDIKRIRPKDLIYCLFNGEPQIKEYRESKGRQTLVPRNLEDHSPIPIQEGDELVLLGVVHDLVQREAVRGKR